MDLTFQVPMQYCSLQHWTLLLSPVTSTTGYCFCFGSIPSFFLELFLHWFPVAYWVPTNLGSSSFSILPFCLFILCHFTHLILFWFNLRHRELSENSVIFYFPLWDNIFSLPQRETLLLWKVPWIPKKSQRNKLQIIWLCGEKKQHRTLSGLVSVSQKVQWNIKITFSF